MVFVGPVGNGAGLRERIPFTYHPLRVGLWDFRPTQCPTSMVPRFALDSGHITFCVLSIGDKEICLIHHCHQVMRTAPGT